MAASTWSEILPVFKDAVELWLFDFFAAMDAEWGRLYFGSMKPVPYFLWVAPMTDLPLGRGKVDLKSRRNIVYLPVRRLLQLSHVLMQRAYRKAWPSRPVGRSLLAIDTDQTEALIGSYFDTFPPGHGRKPGGGDLDQDAGAVWRHGDWLRILPDGSCVIYGRSDATINRHGLRMGTSELYSAVEALPEVLDSMVVDLEYLGRESYMPLFVVLRPGLTLDDPMTAKINGAIRTALSPRFLPNEVLQVAEIPRTLSGKKQELPIKKLLLGQPLDKVINKEAMANPGCLDWFVEFARRRADATRI